jgi:hypothetical protein
VTPLCLPSTLCERSVKGLDAADRRLCSSQLYLPLALSADSLLSPADDLGMPLLLLASWFPTKQKVAAPSTDVSCVITDIDRQRYIPLLLLQPVVAVLLQLSSQIVHTVDKGTA